MKKIVITLLLLPLLGFAQTIENIDYISPFHEGLAAIKKGEKWAFINQEAKIVVDFRDDLVLTKTDDASYPIFSNERCLIAHQKSDVLYYDILIELEILSYNHNF
ncbi:WG repeat-containing protein [Aequorivita nionensis]|uniref:WG repeat-containing protein n=1 Tax=Aequorivita nionensis TaxID=1287690 RepID=UPI0039658F1C